MSAIAGIYNIDGKPVVKGDISRMLDSLAHRGADAAGIWSESAIGVGHRMRWTTPESLHETLPFLHRDGDWVITADARIDNREELIAGLDLADSAGSLTDSRLILAAYKKWGEMCPEKLLGDFAFAVWDRRKQALFCARDQLGVKPFYYHLSGRVFAFASEIKGLMVLRDVPSRINEVKIAFHLQPNFLEQDKEMTFYQDIFRLPPAHKMTVTVNGARRRSYWSLDPERELRLKSDDQYSDAFREIFKDAVRCRLRSAFEVGSTLSGGLDSSSIACTARSLLADRQNGRLHTFSAIFPDLPEKELRKIDERGFVDAVVAMGGLIPHYVRADHLSPLADMKRVLWHEDGAVFAPNLYMHWGMYNEAQRQGVRVLLDGIDGDTTVSHGIGYLAELARAGKWISMVKEATALSGKAGGPFPPWKVVWLYGLRPLVPKSFKQTWRRLRGRSQIAEFINPIIRSSFAERVGLAERAQVLLDNLSGPTRSAREEHRQGLNSGLLPYVLEIADKAAAAFSLEPRYPFCDRRLVEFCLAVPADQKLHQGWTRAIMRRAMAGILPDEIRWRIGKANLSPNFQLGLLNGDRQLLDDILVRNPGMLGEYVDIPALRKVYSRYIGQQGQQDSLMVYSAATLALWLSESTGSGACEKRLAQPGTAVSAGEAIVSS